MLEPYWDHFGSIVVYFAEKTSIMSDTQENWLCMYQSEAQPLVLLDKWSPPGKMDEHQSLGLSFQSSQSLLGLRNVKFSGEIFKEQSFCQKKGQLPLQQGGTSMFGVSDRQKWRKQIVETNEMPLCCKSRKRTPCPTACVTWSHFRVLKRGTEAPFCGKHFICQKM